MPILQRERDIFPEQLLVDPQLLTDNQRAWWCFYTLSRREKEFMRRLANWKIAHYGPIVPKRFRSPNGRLRTSYIPLFPNYVFVLASEEERYRAVTTACVSKHDQVIQWEQLLCDLRQIHKVISAGVPLTPEARLDAGSRVRVRSGPFSGYEGLVIRREGKTRLLLSIRFLEQGVSIEMDEGILEPMR